MFVLPGTVKRTVPLRVPLLPEMIVINASLLAADHSQSVPLVFNLTVLVPPLAVRWIVVGLRVTWQLGLIPAACVTLNVCPAMVMEPASPKGMVLGAMV